MKTINGTFLIKNLDQVIIDSEFDNEDEVEIRERAEKHTPLIVATNHLGQAQSIYLTFSEGDKGYCILSNCNDEELMNDVLNALEYYIEEI